MRQVLFALLAAALFAGCAAAPRLETRFDGDRTVLLRDGAELDFETCLAGQLRAHPAMRGEDVLKLCMQGARGPEHILGHTAAARRYFDAEFSAVEERPREPLFEVISPDFIRVDLGAWKARKLPPEWLFNLFAASARHFADGDAVFADYCKVAERTLTGELRSEFLKLPKNGGPVHHSEAYRRSERPAYRLVSTRFLNALPVLTAAAALPEKSVRIIAVDGRAASGKTTLARQLAGVLDAGSVHMDDFFLPPELRTEARYREPGGNVHYERFAAEVLPRLASPEPFSYRVFDCSTMRCDRTAEVRRSKWRIVEGAYSLHPKFGDYADLKVFYDIAPEEQLRRIRARNGEAGARMFQTRWIPLEEAYIRAYDVAGRADIVIGR